MNNFKMSSPQSGKINAKRAQAMVEFMLVIPVLIVLLYGILEVSRLIFIFASVANASRSAARYGAGSGEFDGMTYYQDCEGIREVANKSAILTEFDDINITYDRGVTPDGEQIPVLDIDPNPDADTCPIEDNIIRNGDRIIVQVSASYQPILPILNIEPVEVVSANARTFLISVPIFGSAFPTGFKAETATPSRVPTKTSSAGRQTETATAAILETATFNSTYEAIRTASPRTPTNTLPPTITFTPSNTSTATRIPSTTPTAISCTGDFAVTHGGLEFEDNVMRMDISNNTGYRLDIAQIYVEWNHDTGGNPSLRLNQVDLAGQVWTGDLFAPSGFITAFYPDLPTGESTIQFIFDQNYSFQDGTERIIITIGNPGCVNYPVDSRN
jgi:hypothetical protein